MITVMSAISIDQDSKRIFDGICKQLKDTSLKLETGCLLYLVCCAKDNPLEYVIIEQFVDEEAYEKHENSAYVAAAKPMYDKCLVKPPVIKKYQNID